MKDLDELEEYIEKTEDVQLSIMTEIVKEYGDDIYGILKSLKELHTGDEDRVSGNDILHGTSCQRHGIRCCLPGQ